MGIKFTMYIRVQRSNKQGWGGGEGGLGPGSHLPSPDSRLPHPHHNSKLCNCSLSLRVRLHPGVVVLGADEGVLDGLGFQILSVIPMHLASSTEQPLYPRRRGRIWAWNCRHISSTVGKSRLTLTCHQSMTSTVFGDGFRKPGLLRNSLKNPESLNYYTSWTS